MELVLHRLLGETWSLLGRRNLDAGRAAPSRGLVRDSLAFCQAGSSLFATRLDKASVLERDEFSGAVALFLVLPGPLVLEFLATKGPGDFNFQGKIGLLDSMCTATTCSFIWVRVMDARAFTTRFNGRWLAWR